MKTQTVLKKLSNFRQAPSNRFIAVFMHEPFYSRFARYVRVVDQGNGSCTALPIIVEEVTGNERVAFHAKTIKSLVDFLEGK